MIVAGVWVLVCEGSMIFSKNPHQWVIFRNPRNGRVKVHGCAKCGAIRNAVTDADKCVSNSPNQLMLAGWKMSAQR